MNVRRARNLWGISFRHSSPLARLLSVVVAIAVTALIALVAAPATASGGGSAAGAAGAGSVGPSSLGSSSTTTKPAPSAKTAGASKATSVGKVALTSHKSFAAQLTNLAAAITVPCIPGTGTIVGGFEIDGDTCVEGVGTQDWDSTGMHTDDGFSDSTAFTNGASENDTPTSWGIGGSPNGKTDIGEFWAYSKAVNNTVYGYFGLTNDSTSGGTSQYDLEYNQLDPVSGSGGHPVPQRSPGDLLFRFSSTGSAAIAFTDAKKYTLQSDAAWGAGCFATDATGGWCTIPIPPNAFAQQVNADGTFFEGAIDIGLFFGNGDCSGNFGVVSVRSVTGNAFATSALKDYVQPLGVDTPSTCGSIVINKFDAGSTHVGGAHFTISPDPTPGSNDPGPVTLVDGGTGDADGTANGTITINPAQAGDYTVVETQAPPGYLLPPVVADRTEVITLDPGAGQVATFNFHDPLQWKALTATKTAVPTYTASYAWSVAKEISADGQDPWVTDSSVLTPLLKNVAPNGNPTNTTLSYRVKVTAGARTTSDYAVSGNISVTNPNADPVTANISDALPGATCLVAGDATHTVAVPSGTTPYAYVCTFSGVPSANELSGDNTATVTWDKSDYPQTDADQTALGDYSVSPTASYAFGAETTSVNKTVTVTDDHHVFPGGGLQVTWTGEGDVTTSDVYTIPFEAVPGDCSAIITNTASITGDSDVLGTAQASGQVCVPLGVNVADTAVGDFTRQYHWKIDKFINGDQKSQTVTTSDLTATFDYTVAATPLGAEDSAWVVTGTITVTNPNQNELIDPIHVTGVSELLDLGVGATCTYDTPTPFDLASGDHADIGFTCQVPPTPNNDGGVPPVYQGTHQANATFGDAGTVTSDAQALTWNDPTEIDKTLAVYDNKVTESAAPVHLGDAVWNAAGTPTTFTYQQTFTVPASTEGSCAPEFDNLAWLGGDGVTPTDLQSGAAATICVPAVLPPLPPTKAPLPDTGGPDLQLLLWGLALLVTGGGIVLLTSRRRERRS